VTVFIPENEDANSLEEALEQIKSLNPGWNPRNFLVDFSMAEIAAIEKVLPRKFLMRITFVALKKVISKTFHLDIFNMHAYSNPWV